MQKKTIFLGLGLLGAAVVGGMLAGIWVFRNVDARLGLKDQPAIVQIPGEVAVIADVLNELQIEIDTAITTTVPVDQRIKIPLTDTLHVQASFDSSVPIKMNVPVKDYIVIDQLLDVDTVVKADLLGDTHDLPLRGKIPVKARVPVSLNIPVDQKVHLKFTAPVDVKFTEPLDVPLKTDISTTIPIRSKMSVPVKSALKANIQIPDPAKIIITEADLRLPLRTLTMTTKGEPAEAAPAKPASAAQP